MAKNFAALPKLPPGSAVGGEGSNGNSTPGTTPNSPLMFATNTNNLASSPTPLDLDAPGSKSTFFNPQDRLVDTSIKRNHVNTSSNLSASYTSEEIPFPIDSLTEEPAAMDAQDYATFKKQSLSVPNTQNGLPLPSPSTPTPSNPKPELSTATTNIIPASPISGSFKRKPWEKSSSSVSSLPLHLPPAKALSSTSSESVHGSIEPQPQATISSLPTNTAGILNLHEMYSNLNTRLQPFFASVLPLRTVLVEVRPRLIGEEKDKSYRPHIGHQTEEEQRFSEVIFSQEYITSANGTFESTVTIPWDTLVESPACLGIIFPDKLSAGSKWALEVTATLMPAFVPQSYGTDGKKRAVEKEGGRERGIVTNHLTPLGEAEGIRIISDIGE